LADRGLRQAGFFRDLRPGRRSGTPQQVEDGTLIYLPHPGGRADRRSFDANHQNLLHVDR
jgi:hypothetical protein